MLFGLSCMAGHAQSGELYFCLTPIEETDYKNGRKASIWKKTTITSLIRYINLRGYFFNLEIDIEKH